MESLENEYRNDGGFAVIYGRRRVGKTTLIKEFIKNKTSFYFLATEEVESQSFFEAGEELFRQVESVILSKNGFLYEEPNFLLKDEVQSAANYFSIIRAIADGNHKLGKIAGALHLCRPLPEAGRFVCALAYWRVLARIWLNDLDSGTEIDVMAVDHQNKRVFAGECKYHAKPVDAPVYFILREKVQSSTEIQTVFQGYQTIYGVFSKSGFTQRLLELAHGNPQLILMKIRS